MIPILYESNETEFTSNGLGRLRDATSVVVTEERNGVYECSFEYPVGGQNYDLIQLGRIIAVKHDGTDDIQPFDIVSYSRPINGIVQFNAVHISYRQSKMVASGNGVRDLVSAFAMLRGAVPSNPFSYDTDITSTIYLPTADGIPRSVRTILGGEEGSILDTYGGEYEWDKFNVKLWQSRGRVLDLTIRYGVNMTDFEDSADISDSYSSIVPYWAGSDATIKGNIVNSGAPTSTGRVEAVAVDFSGKFENRPTAAQLQAAASSMLAAEQPYLPAQSITVSFTGADGEQGEISDLRKCQLCDTVTVEFPRYDMSGQFKIVRTVYDVLSERFDEMELGTLSVTLSEALGITGDSALKESSAADYVVEQGTVNATGNYVSAFTWTYRKWQSGVAECWAQVTVNSNTYAANNGYRSFNFNYPPGLFIAAPSNLQVSGGIDACVQSDIGFTRNNNAAQGQSYLINRNASALTQAGTVYIHVCGRWK